MPNMVKNLFVNVYCFITFNYELHKSPNDRPTFSNQNGGIFDKKVKLFGSLNITVNRLTFMLFTLLNIKCFTTS